MTGQQRLYFVVMLGFTLLFLSRIGGYCTEKWISFAKSEKGDEYYYDEGSIKAVEKKVVQVWRMKKLSAASRDDYAKIDQKNINVDSVKTLVELDCRKKTLKAISVKYYDSKGELLQSLNDPDSGRRVVRPVSRSEMLLNAVCSK